MGGLLPPAERRSSVLVALYVALSLLLLMVGDRIPTTSLRDLGASLFAPLDHIVLTVDRLVSAWTENRELHERLTGLELENARLRGLAGENDRLRAELALPEVRTHKLVPVEVLALTGEPYPAAATLSAGRHSGLKLGDAVLTRDGLVGRLTEVYADLSRAALLTDPNAAVACEVESTGVLGVLRFSAVPSPRLLLTGVPFSDTVAVGQRLLTSGYSRRYPHGIPVGRIVKLSRDANGLTQSIEVVPSARLSRLRHVLVTPGPSRLGVQP